MNIQSHGSKVRLRQDTKRLRNENWEKYLRESQKEREIQMSRHRFCTEFLSSSSSSSEREIERKVFVWMSERGNGVGRKKRVGERTREDKGNGTQIIKSNGTHAFTLCFPISLYIKRQRHLASLHTLLFFPFFLFFFLLFHQPNISHLFYTNNFFTFKLILYFLIF